MCEELLCVSLQVKVRSLCRCAIKEICNVFEPNQDEVLFLRDHVDLQVTIEAIEDISTAEAFLKGAGDADTAITLHFFFDFSLILLVVHSKEILHRLIN